MRPETLLLTATWLIVVVELQVVILLWSVRKEIRKLASKTTELINKMFGKIEQVEKKLPERKWWQIWK